MATSDASVNAVDQVRQDYQYDASVDGLLKQVYIPALNNTTFHATPLLEMFGDYGGTIDYVGNKIIKAFKHQGAGGFGGIPEGGTWVTGRKQKGFQGWTRIKFLNAFVSLTGPAAKTVRSGVGAYVDAISSAMDDTLKLARMNMERIVGGSGNGVICEFTAAAVDHATKRTGLVATSGTGGYTPVQWLQEGMRVDVCDDTSGTLETGGGGGEVSQIDYQAGTFSLQTDSSCTPTAGTTYLTLENAYGDVETEGTVTPNQCLEPNGLTNLVDDGSNFATIWNLTRTSYPHALKSSYDNSNVEIDEPQLMDWILDLVNIKQSTPTVLVTDPKSRLKYFQQFDQDRQFNTGVFDTSFGFRSLGITIDQYTMLLQSLSSLKPGTLFMLNTNDFKFAKATNGFEWAEEGGKVFRNYETKDAMYATAVNYMDFVCENPNGQFKANNLIY